MQSMLVQYAYHSEPILAPALRAKLRSATLAEHRADEVIQQHDGLDVYTVRVLVDYHLLTALQCTNAVLVGLESASPTPDCIPLLARLRVKLAELTAKANRNRRKNAYA